MTLCEKLNQRVGASGFGTSLAIELDLIVHCYQNQVKKLNSFLKEIIMRSKNYLLALPLILFSSLIIFNSLLSGNKISAQQDDDSQLTEEQLVARFTRILDQEIPLLDFKVENDGAGEIKAFLINAARTFIGENDFSVAQKSKADDQIRLFAQRLKQNSENAGTAKVDEKKLIDAPVQTDGNINQNRNTDDRNVSTPASNINQPTAPAQNINQEVNANTNINVNIGFRQRASKSSPSVSPGFGYSFAPMQDNSETLDFQRRKINKRAVNQSRFSLCPLIPICRSR